MKFNLKKWQALEQRREDLYRKLQAINEDMRLKRGQLSKQQGFFLQEHDVNRDQPIKRQIMIDRKLSHAAILDRLALMRKNFAAICGDFSLNHDAVAKHSLIDLYTEMVSLKRVEEVQNKASGDTNNFMASWNVLEEFASHKIKIIKPVNVPVAENSNQLA